MGTIIFLTISISLLAGFIITRQIFINLQKLHEKSNIKLQLKKSWKKSQTDRTYR